MFLPKVDSYPEIAELVLKIGLSLPNNITVAMGIAHFKLSR